MGEFAYSKEMGFVAQDATVDDISFKYKGYTIPYGYYKFLGDFSMFTPDGKASPHEVLSLKNYDFDAAVKFFENAEVIRQNELLQQIANGEERDRYRKMLKDGEITTNELERVIKEKRDEVVAEVVGETKYDLDENSSKVLQNDAKSGKIKNKPRYIKISNEVHRSLLWELRDVYGDVETAVADEVAVALGNTVYVVDSGREEGKITCRAIDKVVIEDQTLREEYIRRKNHDALSKGYISDGLSGRFRSRYADNRQGNRRQEVRSNLQADNGKSANNQSGVSKANATNRGLKSKSSHELDIKYLDAVNLGDMETAQRMVDEAAKRAMPNSVLVDSNGNLIKMYHGSPETFNVFKGKEMGSNGNYFSPWKAFAEQYGEVRAY